MKPVIRDDHPIRSLFSGLVENALFTELGVCEPKLADYLAGLMVDFIHVDRLAILHQSVGRGLEHMAAMLALTDPPEPTTAEERDRRIYRYIGDFALFWTGIFPEHLRRRQGGDLLSAYLAQGKHSYAASARLSGDTDQPPCSLLQSLSDEFETCMHGLGLVRRTWQEAGRQTFSGGEILL